jgi:HK97 gp10 family phage protein
MNFKATSRFTSLNAAAATRLFATANRLSVEQAAEAVLQEAESLVPVDTGELLASGHVEITSSGSTQQASAQVIFDSDHAAFVEFGTGIRGAESPSHGPGPYDPNWPGMAAQPYLRPGLDNARPFIVEIFRDNYELVSEQLGGKA